MARPRRRGGVAREPAPEKSMDPRPSEDAPYRPTVINNPIYRDGRPIDTPGSLADAFRSGKLGILDYYRLKNVQADTDMRESIAGAGVSRAQ